MSIIQDIKELVHGVSNDYILSSKGLNSSIRERINDGLIENNEILKRVCELSNQSVYLSLFHNSKTNRANIKFPVADYETLKNDLVQRENSMNDYDVAPKDFREGLTFLIEGESGNESIKVAEQKSNRLQSMQKHAQNLRRLELFKLAVDTMRVDEIKTAENAYYVMANNTKEMVVGGDSAGDIAKIACKHVQNAGLNFMKVAEAYSEIIRDIRKEGFSVDLTLTKISSEKINIGSEILEPVEQFIMSIEKIAACGEMSGNVDRHIEAYKKALYAKKK